VRQASAALPRNGPPWGLRSFGDQVVHQLADVLDLGPSSTWPGPAGRNLGAFCVTPTPPPTVPVKNQVARVSKVTILLI